MVGTIDGGERPLVNFRAFSKDLGVPNDSKCVQNELFRCFSIF